MATEAVRPAKPRRRQPVGSELPESPNPVDIAMAAAASGKPLPDVARRVLEEHANLVHAQCAELKLRKVGEGVRAALWAILALVALGLLAVIIAVVVRAAKSDALVVQSFEVPPSLRAQGLTGKVVATQILDRLAEMQKQTQSIRAASTYANNWENDLSIDIPNTRATTDQVWKLLRGWLGKETRISGEVIDTGTGLALTARVGSEPGQRFVSDKRDLDALVTQGAELIYKQTQPYRYSVYISRGRGRQAEQFAVLGQLSKNPSAVERKWALNGISVEHRDLGNLRAARATAERALAIDANMLPAIGNLASVYGLLGGEQEQVDTLERSLRAPVSEEYNKDHARRTRCASQGNIGIATPDPEIIREATACLSAMDNPFAAQSAESYRSWYAIYRHEPLVDVVLPGLPDDVPGEAAYRTAAARLRGYLARGPGRDFPAAFQQFEAALADRRKPGPEEAFVRAVYPTQGLPLRARGLAMLGRYREAEALIRQSPIDCYECLRVRGLVAEGLGRPNEAQQYYSRAVHAAPRLARAYVDWARLLARHQRFEGAERRFAKAAKLAPNWADPLKYWGDALAAQGKHDEALDKYDAASKLAPKWPELVRARAGAAQRL